MANVKCFPVIALFLGAALLNLCLIGLTDARTFGDLRVMRPVANENPHPPVSIISKADYVPLSSKNNHLSAWTEQGLKPMPMSSYYRKKKVDTQKFRECIFFQLCEKSGCFNYGRYGTC